MNRKYDNLSKKQIDLKIVEVKSKMQAMESQGKAPSDINKYRQYCIHQNDLEALNDARKRLERSRSRSRSRSNEKKHKHRNRDDSRSPPRPIQLVQYVPRHQPVKFDIKDYLHLLQPQPQLQPQSQSQQQGFQFQFIQNPIPIQAQKPEEEKVDVKSELETQKLLLGVLVQNLKQDPTHQEFLLQKFAVERQIKLLQEKQEKIQVSALEEQLKWSLIFASKNNK